ncbi:MAG: Crp/Fnr family transcriptional regulator [bacterium]|nr:Crp/Fnr family transcriptional regulator [bacterium]
MPRTFKPGALLWREGDTNGMLVSLAEGRVKIYRLMPDGNSVTNYIFGPGDVFGFMPLFDDAPYPAFAQAVGSVRAGVVTRAQLHEAIQRDPVLASLLLKQLSRRLRAAFDQIEALSVRGVIHKVALALASLMSSKQPHEGLEILNLPVSSAEFAKLYGLTPESFSRGVTQLVENGIVHRLRVNSFQVLKPQELRDTARTYTF